MKAKVTRRKDVHEGEIVDVVPYINKNGQFAFLMANEIDADHIAKKGITTYHVADLVMSWTDLSFLPNFSALVVDNDSPIFNQKVEVALMDNGRFATTAYKTGERYTFDDKDLFFHYVADFDPWSKEKEKDEEKGEGKEIGKEGKKIGKDDEKPNVQDAPFELTFADVVSSMTKIQEAKNHDYGGSFEKTLEEFGPVVLAIRLSDKLNRFKTLIKADAQVKDESIIDTLKDLANYAVMGVVWMENNKPVK